jgi:hypothetical protein
MTEHEEFLELCASATAGELSPAERDKLEAHLTVCSDCRRALKEYEIASHHGMARLATEASPPIAESQSSWSVDKAERELFRRVDAEKASANAGDSNDRKQGQRFTYRPSRIRWHEVWMPFAAAILLALALGVVVFRSGLKGSTDVAQSKLEPTKSSTISVEEQISDVGHEKAQLLAKLGDQDRTIAELRRQLGEQKKTVSALLSANGTTRVPTAAGAIDSAEHKSRELAAAQVKLTELQRTVDTLSSQRNEATSRAATLDAKVSELTQLARDRERELDEKQVEVAKQQELLDRDRDIRELMGARDLYIAEVHDVDGKGETSKTYSRIFYARGKKLIFYAYDLDAQSGLRNASTFQVWGRRGPDKQRARSLGVLYEDNVDKKRWVLKANDPKTLEDIDAVFVTVEPDGGSQHPSGKQLLFASLRVNPNHP